MVVSKVEVNEKPSRGLMVNWPDVLNAIVPEALTSSDTTAILLLETVTAVPLFAPKVAEPKLFTMPTLRAPVLSVMSPDEANKFSTPPWAACQPNRTPKAPALVVEPKDVKLMPPPPVATKDVVPAKPAPSPAPSVARPVPILCVASVTQTMASASALEEVSVKMPLRNAVAGLWCQPAPAPAPSPTARPSMYIFPEPALISTVPVAKKPRKVVVLPRIKMSPPPVDKLASSMNTPTWPKLAALPVPAITVPDTA